MSKLDTLRSLDAIRLLADPRRLEILRRLMAAPATLSQLGSRMKRSPAWIRHHLVALERVGLVQLHEVRVVGKATEKYYRAASGALRLEQLVLPKSRLPIVIFSGSHDPALEAAAGRVGSNLLFLSAYVGSLNGLTDLRHGTCQVSGIHLLDVSGEYNRPYVRHFFPDREVELVTLAQRTQGLMVAAGNPCSIHRVEDLARPGVRFINRNPGSGTRLYIDSELHRRGISPASIRGYQHEVVTHTAAAECIRTGKADAAMGLQAAAHASGLGFVPLFEERYDLVMATADEKMLSPMLDYIQTAAFRSSASAMSGYNTAHSGELIPI